MSIATSVLADFDRAVAFMSQIDAANVVASARHAIALAEQGTVISDVEAAQVIAQQIAAVFPAAAPAETALAAIKTIIVVGQLLGARPVQPGDPAYTLPDRGDGVGA